MTSGALPLRRPLRIVLLAAALIGMLVGIAATVGHLDRDPLADVRAYYDAGARLNAGQPLYPPGADTRSEERRVGKECRL